MTAQLFNLTDGMVLATTSTLTIRGNADALYTPLDRSLSYTAIGTDVGDQLQLRFVEQDDDASRFLPIYSLEYQSN